MPSAVGLSDVEHLIDTTDPIWAMPSPTLASPTLAVGTELTIHGYKRPICATELGWLHAAITSMLGREHDQDNTKSCLAQYWNVRPWPTQSGCAIIWWDPADGAAMARRRHAARIGKIEVELECGPPVRIHAPPRWLGGAYPVRIETRSLVSVASKQNRGDRAGQRNAHPRASAMCIESALVTIARKLRIPLDAPPRVIVIADRTRPDRVHVRAKTGRVEGWSGQVDVLASPLARWLLECASRGLGLGARGAYGFGSVLVSSLEDRISAPRVGPRARVASS